MPDVYVVTLLSIERRECLCSYALPRYMALAGVFAEHATASAFLRTSAVVAPGTYAAIVRLPLRTLDSDALVVAELRARAAAYACTYCATAARSPSLDTLIKTMTTCSIKSDDDDDDDDDKPPSLVCSPRSSSERVHAPRPVAAHSLVALELA